MQLVGDVERGLDHLMQALRSVGPSADTWLMIVRESHLVFASWQVPIGQLRPLVPASLELDLYDGQAWITVEMLQTTLVRFHGLPALPIPINGVEMNVRTYVRCNGQRGIHFLSMDCPGMLGSALMRWFSGLPLFEADVTVALNGDNYHAESTRVADNQTGVRFALSARVMGPPQPLEPGSIDQFLLNQTLLFVAGPTGPVRCGRVDHRPHVVQPIQGIVEINTLVSNLGLTVPVAPTLLHYCPGDDSLAYPTVTVTTAAQ